MGWIQMFLDTEFNIMTEFLTNLNKSLLKLILQNIVYHKLFIKWSISYYENQWKTG